MIEVIYNLLKLTLFCLGMVVLFCPMLICYSTGNYWYLFLFFITPSVSHLVLSIGTIVLDSMFRE